MAYQSPKTQAERAADVINTLHAMGNSQSNEVIHTLTSRAGEDVMATISKFAFGENAPNMPHLRSSYRSLTPYANSFHKSNDHKKLCADIRTLIDNKFFARYNLKVPNQALYYELDTTPPQPGMTASTYSEKIKMLDCSQRSNDDVPLDTLYGHTFALITQDKRYKLIKNFQGLYRAFSSVEVGLANSYSGYNNKYHYTEIMHGDPLRPRPLKETVLTSFKLVQVVPREMKDIYNSISKTFSRTFSRNPRRPKYMNPSTRKKRNRNSEGNSRVKQSRRVRGGKNTRKQNK